MAKEHWGCALKFDSISHYCEKNWDISIGELKPECSSHSVLDEPCFADLNLNSKWGLAIPVSIFVLVIHHNQFSRTCKIIPEQTLNNGISDMVQCFNYEPNTDGSSWYHWIIEALSENYLQALIKMLPHHFQFQPVIDAMIRNASAIRWLVQGHRSGWLSGRDQLVFPCSITEALCLLIEEHST